jgi:hypothetical protein
LDAALRGSIVTQSGRCTEAVPEPEYGQRMFTTSGGTRDSNSP